MGTPISFGPFTEEKCGLVSERMFAAFEDEIREGKILKVGCWKMVGA